MVAVQSMREMRDDSGVERTVYKVERQVRSLGKGAAGLLPEPYVNGSLVFQSLTEKRRFAPCPATGERLPEASLRSYLAVATRARPSGIVSEDEIDDHPA